MAAPAKGDPAGARDAGARVNAEVVQDALASGQAIQAVLGSGEQHLHFGDRARPVEPAVSLAPPFGVRTDDLPIRGRDELLAELTGHWASSSVRVLHGLGGCGKTRLALEMAFRANQEGVEVWWVSAADETGFLGGMRSIGRRLGVSEPELEHGDAADVIWRRLAARREPWLLVIDNADEPTMLAGVGPSFSDGRGWLRPLSTGSAGSVIVTSRDGSRQSWGSWVERIKLAMLTEDWAAVMLADYAGPNPQFGTEEDAKALAARLGRLPLALKIVGSSLASSADIPRAFADPGAISTYHDYLNALELGTAEVLRSRPNGELTQAQARVLVDRTWELTLDQLEARHLSEARSLIRLLACFADAPIPYELLLSPAELAESQLFSGISGTRLWQILSALDEVGLIDLTRAKDSADGIGVIRLHPLVRDTSRPDAIAEYGPTLFAMATAMLECATTAPETESPRDPSTWPIWRLLAPHVLQGVYSSKPDNADANMARATANAVYRAARYLISQGLHEQSRDMLGQVLSTRTSELGPEHPDTLDARHQIAYVMSEQGRHVDAEAECRDILATLSLTFGPDHPRTLMTRHMLAYVMAERGRYADAETEYRATLAALRRVLGPDHPDTLTTRHEIARMMTEQGRHDDAETEFRDILTIRLSVLGPDHPRTLTTRLALAFVMANQGRRADAETEFRDLLTAELRVLGPDHPDTLKTKNWIDYLERRRQD